MEIRLNIWEHKTTPSLTMILYEDQIPFPDSPSLQNQWRIFFSFLAFNPLVPPYPSGTELFRAIHYPRYPFEFKEIVPVLDVYNVDDLGTYFAGYTASYEHLTKLPFKDTYVYVKKL
jgi:hypothetical protein